jgi:hypothetical protein
MTEPTNRAALGRLLRLLMTTNPDHHDVGSESRRRVVEYIDIAEDTIEQQAGMLLADTAEIATQCAGFGVELDALGQEVERLKAENATLRKFGLAALHVTELALAGHRLDDAPERLAAIRTELEKIS